MAKILLVEDDTVMLQMIEDYLAADRHQVETVNNGDDAWDRLKFYQFDLVILDWQLPGMSGIEILKQLRHKSDLTPVLMLTGKGEIDDKELGLNSGADDYLTKPFNGRELNARVKALLRRAGNAADNTLKAGDITLDRELYRATKGGEEIHLVPREFDLLEFLMRNPNRVFSARALLNQVWSSESDATDEAVVTCIKRLRKKIDTDGTASMIKTIYGVGYKLEP